MGKEQLFKDGLVLLKGRKNVEQSWNLKAWKAFFQKALLFSRAPGGRWKDITEEEGGRRWRRMKNREAVWGWCRNISYKSQSTHRSRRTVYSLSKCRMQVSQGAIVNGRLVLLTDILSVLWKCAWVVKGMTERWALISIDTHLKKANHCTLVPKPAVSFLQLTGILPKNMSQTAVGLRMSLSRELSVPPVTSLPAAETHRNKHTCCIHPVWRKSLNRQAHPPSPHPFLPCCCNALSKPRVLLLHPIVPACWGMGHSDRLKQRASEKDNRQLCIWRVKYAWEAKAGEGKGGALLCDPLSNPKIQAYTHTCILCPRVTDGRMLANIELPPSLFYHPHCWGQLGGRHSFFSAFRGKQKSVWDPSYTHVHVFRHTKPSPQPQKTVNATVGWSYFSSLGLSASRGMLSLGHLLKVKVSEIIPTLLTGLVCWYVGSTSEVGDVCWEL